MYVELLNNKNQPVLQGKIALKDGSGSGSFMLPFSIESGNYELRAYTNWMKNNFSDHYFKKIITIINTTENLDPSIVKNKTVYFVQFFPEGGNLVNGLKSIVAFKINNNFGKSVDGEGIVVDESQDTVAHFQTEKFGMGKFLFTPQTGKHYTAIVTLRDNSVIRKNLPDAYESGYVMHVSDDANDLKISVTSANQTPQKVYLISQTNNETDFSASAFIQNNQALFIIHKHDLKDGIAQITLFTNDGRPLCERLYFKRPNKQMVINAKADKQNFTKREKVNIDLYTAGDLIAGNLSASVFRLDSLHKPEDDNIFTYLWLTSNLKGAVENPDYYFKNENAETNSTLNNLLLTQGWRTFDWKNISKAIRPSLVYVPENRGHIVLGKITNEVTGKPAENVLVYLSVPGKRVQLYGCLSNSDGLIHYDLKDFYGSNQIVLQTNTSKDSVYHLEILSPFSEEFSNFSLPDLHISENDRDNLQSANLHMKISKTYHENDLQKLELPLIDSLPFYGKPNKTYLLDDYTRFTTIEEVMREYVTEVNVIRRKKENHFNTLNVPALKLKEMQPVQIVFEQDPLILLDGVPVFDVTKLLSYDPLKIRKLDVVASKYYWGPIVSEGILSFTTYKGNLQDYTLNPHDVILDYDGLQQQRIFYSPDYSSDQKLRTRFPDFRDVLYWSPDVQTDKNGKGNISFFTGDIPGKYLVVLQGVSSTGVAGCSSFILNIVK